MAFPSMWTRAPVHLRLLEGVQHAALGHGQPDLRVPPPVQQLEGTQKPGDGDVLQCIVSQNPASWSQQLLWVEYAHNTLTSSATELSPFRCAYGFQLPLFPTQDPEVSCPSVKRLTSKFFGPFEIQKVIHPAKVGLKLPQSMCIHPAFYVFRVKPAWESPLIPAVIPLPPPWLIDGGSAYAVHDLLHSCHWGRGLQYLVDLEGYRPKERSWVLARHILDPKSSLIFGTLTSLRGQQHQ